jgi:hypothetical protein
MVQSLQLFAQDYSYYTFDGSVPADDSGMSAVVLIPFIIGSIILGVVSLLSLWKIFEKAGQPGWAAVVPIYNAVVLLQIVGRPIWWVLFYLLVAIPIVGWVIAFVVSVIVMNDLAKSFGKDIGFTALLVLLPMVGLPILGFGDAKYKSVTAPAKGPAPKV